MQSISQLLSMICRPLKQDDSLLKPKQAKSINSHGHISPVVRIQDEINYSVSIVSAIPLF